jgi:hypothetical protein
VAILGSVLGLWGQSPGSERESSSAGSVGSESKDVYDGRIGAAEGNIYLSPLQLYVLMNYFSSMYQYGDVENQQGLSWSLIIAVL